MPAIHLLVALETRYAFDREVFLSIASAAQAYGELYLHHPSHPDVSLTDAAAQTHARGMIISRSSPRDVEQVAALGVPAINVANYIEGHAHVPVVGNDDVAIGETVAEYYLDRGFRHFAYIADADVAYFHPRRDGFLLTLARAGFSCALGPPPPASPAREGRNEPGYEERLGDWLRTLPLPLAVMCPFDLYAVETVHACRLAGLRVPEQVSVMGVDDDPLVCTSATPQISSVRTAATRVGAVALEQLLQLIDGGRPPARPTLFPPEGIAARRSTVEAAIHDPDVAAAVSYIRTHLRQRLTVDDIADHLVISRRTLERKFVAAMGRSPLDEIRRARIALAKQLLIGTDFSLAEVARRSGMLRQQRLSNLFRVECGLTPTEFREKYRTEPTLS